jgi:hypothetical protein
MRKDSGVELIKLQVKVPKELVGPGLMKIHLGMGCLMEQLPIEFLGLYPEVQYQEVYLFSTTVMLKGVLGLLIYS